MPRDQSMLTRMRAAQIPPHAYTTNLKLAGQTGFHETISKKEYTAGPAGLISFLVIPGPRTRPGAPSVSKVCAITAKELTVQGQKVYYTTVGELCISQRMYEKGIDNPFGIHERIGVGYVVIGDIGETTSDRIRAEWSDVQAMLLSHLGRGGGLILGATAMEETLVTLDFQDATSMFTRILVV